MDDRDSNVTAHNTVAGGRACTVDVSAVLAVGGRSDVGLNDGFVTQARARAASR